MALRKTQLKKMSLEEITLHLASESDPENIKLISSFIGEKNAGLMERRSAIAGEIGEVRAKLEKSVRNLNVVRV